MYYQKIRSANQYCNTQEVILWSKRMKNKGKSSFTKFSIAYFYLPI